MMIALTYVTMYRPDVTSLVAGYVQHSGNNVASQVVSGNVAIRQIEPGIQDILETQLATTDQQSRLPFAVGKIPVGEASMSLCAIFGLLVSKMF